MFARTVQMLVVARGASPFFTRQMHSLPDPGTLTTPPSRRYISSHKAGPLEGCPSSSLNLWVQIGEARPAVRYTVYAGVGLMVTAESTFWFHVIKAKFSLLKSAEENEEAHEFLHDLRAVVTSYKIVWMGNYGRYYSAYVWGADYGGLDG